MHIYIKVPPHIAKMLKLPETAKLPDGNYVAMQKQFEKICLAFHILKRAPEMGCAVLKPYDLRQERERKLVTPLPEATDENFKAPANQVVEAEVEQEPIPEPEPAPEPQSQPEPEQEEEIIVTGEVVIIEDEEGGAE